MSKLDDSLLSGSRGRTGRLVVANVNGIEILKVRPRKSKKELSLKQELVQERMKNCYIFLESYKAYACQFFGNHVGLQSQFNQAMANLMGNFQLDYDAQQINILYPKIQFSKGPLLAPIATAISSPAAQQIKVEWYNNAGGNRNREADQIQILCAIEEQQDTILFQNQAQRSDLEATFTLPPTASGKTAHIYIAFLDGTGTIASNSSYVGQITVL